VRNGVHRLEEKLTSRTWRAARLSVKGEAETLEGLPVPLAPPAFRSGALTLFVVAPSRPASPPVELALPPALRCVLT
jgi:hypothetical protein